MNFYYYINKLSEKYINIFNKNDNNSFLDVLKTNNDIHLKIIKILLINVLERLFNSRNSKIRIILGEINCYGLYIIIYLDLE